MIDWPFFGCIFDYGNIKERLAEVELELADASVWDNPDEAQKLGRERSSLESIVSTVDHLSACLLYTSPSPRD